MWKDGATNAARHALSIADLLATLETSTDGLSEDEAAPQLCQFGLDRLLLPPTASVLELLIHQLKSVIVARLAAAAGISIGVGDHHEAAERGTDGRGPIRRRSPTAAGHCGATAPRQTWRRCVRLSRSAPGTSRGYKPLVPDLVVLVLHITESLRHAHVAGTFVSIAMWSQ